MLVTLSGVAELARVRRPVASVWRRRFASGEDAFPAPIAQRRGAPVFDAAEVAEWLVRTSHGNNPEARADAAAAAAPAGLDWSNPAHRAELEALIALSAHLDGLDGFEADELTRVAQGADAGDQFLLREVTAHIERAADWTHFADDLIDAAYSPTGALAICRAKHRAHAAAEGSTAAISDPALELVAAVTTALARHDVERLILGGGVDDETAMRLTGDLGDEVQIEVEPSPTARSIRRRLHVAGVWVDAAGGGTRAVRVARIPVRADDAAERMLADADDLALSMREEDVAVLIGPARVLIDELPAPARAARDDVLRSGRLRAAVRLPQGLVHAATREALALWVLGAPTGDVPIDGRFTAVADLIDGDLNESARDDLVSDILAGMGSAADVRARRFRYARLVRTPSLLARSGALLPPRASSPGWSGRGAALAAQLDAAARAAADDLPSGITIADAAGDGVEPRSLAELLADGHARIVAGTRLSPDIHADSGLVVVTASQLDSPSGVEHTRVDPLEFAQRHPSAQLTRPGDIVFRTGPTAAAWVDRDGSKVVAYPARVLRITAADPGGLVPELVAADIPTQPAGPGAWKRWMLRRVAPGAIAPLRRTLADLAASRADLESRVANLDHYVDTLTSAVAAGAVALTDPNAAPAASDPQ